MTTATDAAATAVPSLLDAQIACARELQVILDGETQALLAADLQALSELVIRKQAAAEELEQLSKALSEASGGAPERLIPSLGSDAQARWQTLIDAADLLRKINLHNGGILHERQARLRWIARQSGLVDEAPLYAANGRGDTSGGNRPAGFGRHLAQA